MVDPGRDPAHEHPPLVVVGAGPVGSLLALLLARRGHRVALYERQHDLRRGFRENGRSINIALSERGLHALRGLGLTASILQGAMPMRGRMVHPESGPRFPLLYGRSAADVTFSLRRTYLNLSLLAAAEATGRVSLHFQHTLQRYDFASELAVFRDEATGDEVHVEAPIIFGADGSASALRASIVEVTGGDVRHERLATAYKELTIPAVDGAHVFERDSLHIWPRQSFLLIAMPNSDGSFTATLCVDLESRPGHPSFEDLSGEAALTAFFERHFPDVVPHVPDLAARLLQVPTGRLANTRVSPWCHERALLIGDSAHALVPFLGQGLNAGFEDCTALDRILDSEAGGPHPNWREIFRTFSRRRKPDTDALAEMSVENHREMRERVTDPRFVLEKDVEARLSARYPGEYVSRYQLITFTRVPYRVAQHAGRIQEAILSEVCAGVACPDDVDYGRARALVKERLRPMLAEYGLLQ
jgi:kynurenine 3-monooxygenase